jgi:hypothetical protein
VSRNWNNAIGECASRLLDDARWFGYGTDENLFPRNPRLDFDEACFDL